MSGRYGWLVRLGFPCSVLQEGLRRFGEARLGSVCLNLVGFVLRSAGLSEAKLGLVILGRVSLDLFVFALR